MSYLVKGDAMDAYLCNACMNTFVITEYQNLKLHLLKLIQKDNIDGLIIYNNNPLSMKIYNRDGSVATMCGNGMRCFLLYGYNKGYLAKGYNEVKTKAGLIQTEIIDTDPFVCKVYLRPDKTFPIKKDVFFVDGEMLFLYTAFVGTLSHVLIYKDGLDKEKVIERIKSKVPKEKLGNISFVKVKSKREIEVLTYERGVGYTLSCGTGNCGVFYVLHSLNLIDDKVKVINKGGLMDISYENDSIVIKSGAYVCERIF